MNCEIKIRTFKEGDLLKMLEVFNYYAKNSFSVYCDFELSIDMYMHVVDDAKVLLIVEDGEKFVGYGYISKFLPFPNFGKTGLLTYFISKEYTEKGIGTQLLCNLVEEGKNLGITNLLANISDKNVQSIRFHEKHGFKNIGTFANVGTKFNENLSIVWMQKEL